MKERLKKNTFRIHTAAFLLMVLPSIGLYFAAATGSIPVVWVLLGLFITANILILLVN
jgi:hypothetical protein